MKRAQWACLGLLVGMTTACQQTDDLVCEKAGCSYSTAEWSTLLTLADLPPPPPDPSNKFVGNAGVELLGRRFFFDARWSGPSTQVDALRRPMTYARAAKGQPSAVSCASCHDMRRGGIDTESLPGNVSIGAAWLDTNALSVINSAYYDLLLWNGRADSLWAQALAATEGGAMNGNRLATVWVMSESYREPYSAAFTEHPLPPLGMRAQVEGMVETTGAKAGQCKLSGTACPSGCFERRNSESNATGCFPRFPLNGRPGSKAGCQPDDATEPFGDAFDCMEAADQDLITRAFVNYGKAIAAYEYKLISKDSAFDKYVDAITRGTPVDHASFPPAAERGARLFVGKAACVDCHNTPLLSDNLFHNVGVPQVGPGVPTEADCPAGGVCDCVTVTPERYGVNCLPWGALDGYDKLARSKFRRDSKWSDGADVAQKRIHGDLSQAARMKGAYRTPSLRDVAVTAPYMHNGALDTLEEVIEHYDQGGSATAPGARSAQVKPLFLTKQEKADLVAFLKTLTGAPLPAELLTAPK